MVMYLACDTFIENHLTTLDSTFFLKLMPENQGHSGRSVTPRCVHEPNLGVLGFIFVHYSSKSDGSGKGA